MSVKLTFLIDDKPGRDLFNEHGLSILIEAAGLKILFDTGQSSKFNENAETLEINLEDIDFGLVSHGHYDHSGGLPAFFRKNPTAPVFIHRKASEPIYYSTGRSSKPRYIGINQEIFNTDKDRFNFICSQTEPAPGIHILPCTDITDRGPIFNDSSLFLKIGEARKTETFDHEIFLVIERADDYIIVSGCSHNNIAAIIKHTGRLYGSKKLTGVIGGFHLPDVNRFSDEHRHAVEATAGQLWDIAENTTGNTPLFFTGHCTGDRAKLILKEKLGSNIDFFYAGCRIIL